MEDILILNYDNCSYTLVNSDFNSFISKLQPGCIDLILTDLPYGCTNAHWDSKVNLSDIQAAFLKLRKSKNVSMLLFGIEPFSSTLRTTLKHYKYDWIWLKEIATGFLNAKKMPLRNTENISVFYEKPPVYNPQFTYSKPYTRHGSKFSSLYGEQCANWTTISDGKRYPKSLLSFNSEKHKKAGLLHPSQKPLALLEYLIKTYTNPGDTVIDFTAGVNSTGIACLNTGRNYIGIEKDRTFFEISVNRFESAIKEKAESLQEETIASGGGAVNNLLISTFGLIRKLKGF